MARKTSGRVAAVRERRSVSRQARRESGAALLTEDHRRVEPLFGACAASKDASERRRLVNEVCGASIALTQIEEEPFHPARCEALVDDSILDRAQVEHDGARSLIADLLDARSGDACRDATVEVPAAEMTDLQRRAAELRPRRAISL